MNSYFINALIITLIIPAIGIAMGLLRKIVYSVIAIFSPGLAFIIANYLTFPGVIHHELSHAVFAFITGAKITNITLFKPEGMTLGKVEMIYRGPYLFRSIQACVSAAAPVFCGMFTSYFLWTSVIPSANGFMLYLLYYILFSILMHMTMSIPDLLCYLKGFFGVYILAFVILILSKNSGISVSDITEFFRTFKS